jgi:hypothetical protein
MTDVGRNELRVALDWGAQAAAGYDRLAAEVAVLRAQRDAALEICERVVAMSLTPFSAGAIEVATAVRAELTGERNG